MTSPTDRQQMAEEIADRAAQESGAVDAATRRLWNDIAEIMEREPDRAIAVVDEEAERRAVLSRPERWDGQE